MGQVTSRCMERLPKICQRKETGNVADAQAFQCRSAEGEITVERGKSNSTNSAVLARDEDDITETTPFPIDRLKVPLTRRSDGSSGPCGSSGATSSTSKQLPDLARIEVTSGRFVYNLDLHGKSAKGQNLRSYFEACSEHRKLQVTTSCFAAWRKNKKVNGFAKIIPVAKEGSWSQLADVDDTRPCRVFFFDDNLEFGGKETSPGICNLRDMATGHFVEFAEGQNDFDQERFARHTIVQHSKLWRTVLVKANILDAMEDKEYFAKLIAKFSEPSDRLVVFMDVNATIVCNDTVQGKGLAATLLGTMFELMELRPNPPGFTLKWAGLNEIRVEKTQTLKALLKTMTADDHEAYTKFWQEDNCWSFLSHVLQHGEVRWVTGTEPMTLDATKSLFSSYMRTVPSALDKDGITNSWFHVYASTLKDRHSTILNSFGVDTRKVTLATVSDETDVLHIAINHDMWDERDVKKYSDQFQ
ncbi:unnamed protein product [Symbiodinium necroappetens]|uniref:Uncharacterized protein n=2 Tax=Symbiodinium TaxID=2949 RepID=A0A812QLN2_9DINO|nr:hypothetical protein AK812_SmicGene30484 [Symbiodinium microadriaticum]CAE7250092.1 unnamed protein product [Symbiodinium microadriaticum]CAE7382504.1 unnamed protein product [Symbiodinium sp. KB8]CAE7393124.1 unnamed protein product [Symbiodinium necroappetens]|mmetsp:Transcript_120168/g.285528  ORF Transcript_120168/g.285528 Transcript_120168/m.285528 type:complete len:472 (-) Transcript_120168:41-1456(-)